jgi:hypothetical protein
MTEAEERFAERLAEDLEQVLGAGIIVRDVEIDSDGAVLVRVACLVDGQIRELEARGETMLEAYREVIGAAAELRLAAAWWQIVGPT